MVVYALCYSAIKLGLVFAPPLRFAGLRAAIAGGLLMTAIAVRRQPLSLPRRFWPGTLMLALIGVFVGFGAMFLSPGRTGAGLSSVLGNTGPLTTIVLAAVVLQEPITRRKAAALVLGTFGVAAIAWPAIVDPARTIALGVSLPLLAAAGVAAASVIFKRMNVGTALLRVASWQLLLGAIPLLLLSSVVESGTAVLWTPAFVGLLVFLSLVGTAFALSLWYWLIQVEEVGLLSLSFFLVPVLGLLLAGSVFGETIGPVEVGGVALILAGIAIALRGSAHSAPLAVAVPVNRNHAGGTGR